MASVGGGLRALVVGTGVVGDRMFRFPAPEGVQMPYVTFIEPLSDRPRMEGDGRVLTRRLLAHLDLWQGADEGSAVRKNNLATLAQVLDGARFSADVQVFKCRLDDVQEVPDPDPTVIHHVLTVGVEHGV